MIRAEIERLLPEIFRRTLLRPDRTYREDAPLFVLLEIMELLHEPAELALRNLDATLDPRRTADEFVPFLACWVDLQRFFDERLGDERMPVSPISTGLGRLRELIAAAPTLSKWRGTAKGLRLFLETATGMHGAFVIDEGRSEQSSFHLRVIAPDAARRHQPLIERIIAHEKPAYVTYELIFGDAPSATMNPGVSHGKPL